LTLRQGSNSVLEGNYFIGNGKNRSGGIRVIGAGHTIVNNYFEGLDGRNGGAISISAGSIDPAPPGYAQVRDAIIAHNTIVDVNGAAIFFSDGLNSGSGDGLRNVLAENVAIVNNLISTDQDPLFAGIEGTGFTYESNIAFGQSLGSTSGSGITIVDPLLSRDADGVFRLSSNSPAIDAAFAGFASAVGGIDADGQLRDINFDIGADEFSATPVLRGPLSAEDVGNYFPVVVDGNPPVTPPSTTAGVIIPEGLIVQSDEFTSALDPNNDSDTFTVVQRSDAFGGTTVIAPGGGRADLPGLQDAVLTYDLQFAEAGTYTAYYRGRGFDNGSNSFYTPNGFGLEPSVNESLSNNGVYRWESGSTFVVSNSDLDTTLEFSIGKRESSADLDAFVFHLDGNLSDAELDALFE